MATKNLIRNFCLLCLPFFIMATINLFYKPNPNNTTYTKFSVTTQNTAKKLKKCTWVCHNNTTYCKQNHVKFNHKYFVYTDKLYFGAIKSLNNTRHYEMANIIFLVGLIPLGIWFFITQSLNINSKIKQLQKQNAV